MLCKLIIQTKRMDSTSYINISKDDFEKLVNMIEVDKEFVKEISFSSLDDLATASMPEKSIISVLKKKIEHEIIKNESLLKNESKSLLKQLNDIIAKYNESNFAAVSGLLVKFGNTIKRNSQGMSEMTMFLVKSFKEIVTKQPSQKTIEEVEKYVVSLSPRWEQNVAKSKQIKNKVRKIILENEEISKFDASKIVLNGFERLRL